METPVSVCRADKDAPRVNEITEKIAESLHKYRTKM